MSKIAKDAFAKSNYHLAVEIFERCLRDKYHKNLPITLDLYFCYGDSLARTGRLYEAFDIYTYICNKLNDQIPLERLKHLSSSLLDSLINQQQQQRSHNNETVTSQINYNTSYSNNNNNNNNNNNCSNNFNYNHNLNEQCHLWSGKTSMTSTTTNITSTNTMTMPCITTTTTTATTTATNNNNNNYDSLLCPICNDIFNCPVTATCGHTFCRDCYNQNELKCQICLIKTINNNNNNNSYSKNSNSCFNNNNNNSRNNFGTNLKPDILVRRLVDKWWGPQLQARELNQQTSKYIHLNKFDEALKCCNESLEKCPKNINSLLLRSEVLYKLSHYQSSLADADNALRCHPTSAKAFYRRALALMGLNRNDDAFVAQCIAASLDRNITCTSSFKTDMTRLLQRIITSANKTSSSGQAVHSSAPYSLPLIRKRQQQRRKLKKIAQQQQHQFGTSDCDEENSSCGEDDHHNTNNLHFNRRYSRRNSNIQLEVPIICQNNSKTLRILLDRIQQELRKLKKSENYSQCYLNVNPALIDVADFDCVLCCRTLWKPVVTPCGHTYCWVCLDRCMDYSSSCPLCMTPLVEQYLSNYHQQLCTGVDNPMPFALGEKSVTRFLEIAMQKFIPEWYEKRRRQEIDVEPSVPVFICTTAFPNVPCPLFVYEPRYRLMVRRAIESGERQFGIVQPFTGKSRYSDIGTMLDIRDSVLLGDGCSILSTVGCKRFKILTRNEKDGYETAKVEFINDIPISESTLSQVHCMHSSVFRKAKRWFESLSAEIKEEIFRSFGSMPTLEENWEKLADGPAWAWWIIAILPLNQQLKINILATTNLEKRLRAIGKTLDWINGKVRRSQQNCIAVPCDGLPACQAIECCQRTSTVTATSDEHHVTTNQHTSFLL